MKNKCLVILVAVLYFNSGPVFSQLPGTIKKIEPKISAVSKLNWYAVAMKNLSSKISGSSSSNVISSRNVGSNRVEVGVGLTGSAEGFAPSGSSRQQDNGSSVCTIQPTAINFVNDQNFNLFTGSVSILPGQFFNINSVVNNSFSSFSSPTRKAYQLGINIFNAANPGPNLLNVTDLSRSPLPEIQSTLLSPNYGAFIPAEGIFDMVKINSSFELKAKFNVTQGIFLPLEEFGIPADITAGIEGQGSNSTEVNLKYYMVHFIQPMYTINVLTNHNELFQTSNAFSSCTGGAYVESVTFGRRIVIIIGSAETDTKIRSAISAALSASITGTEAAGVEVGSSVSGETNVSLRNIAQKFHAKVYGGEGSFANKIFGDIVNFKDAFKNYINSSSASQFSAQTGALPLHYTLRRISDNSLLAVRSVGSFDDVVSCNTSKYKVEILWKGFTVNKVLEAPLDDKEDIYGTLKLASVTTNGSGQNKNVTIKSISKSNAISKGEGQTDNDDVVVKVMDNLDKNALVNSILNFSQAFYDWELVTEPKYTENSSSELKFNLSNYESQLSTLEPGQSKTFDNNIKLTESSVVGESRITLITKIRVTRN